MSWECEAEMSDNNDKQEWVDTPLGPLVVKPLDKHWIAKWIELSPSTSPLMEALRRAVASVGRKTRRGKWPLALEHLKELYPIDKHPEGFPDPAFVPRKYLLKDLQKLDKRLESLSKDTLDIAIEEYNRLARKAP
jgi:hypothetical protein